LSKLREHAPKTFEFLENVINECFGICYEKIRNGEFFSEQFDLE